MSAVDTYDRNILVSYSCGTGQECTITTYREGEVNRFAFVARRLIIVHRDIIDKPVVENRILAKVQLLTQFLRQYYLQIVLAKRVVLPVLCQKRQDMLYFLQRLGFHRVSKNSYYHVFSLLRLQKYCFFLTYANFCRFF